MHPVRQAILDILKRQGHATVGELADGLEMAPVSVRHHLDLLIGDNLVCTPRVRRTAAAGRPQRIYALTTEAEQLFPNNYRQLADASLRALKQTLGREGLLPVLDEMAREMAEEVEPTPPGASLAQRADAALSFLNERGYMADYEIDGDMVMLHTCNCPYSELAPEHRELCHLDLILVSELFDLAPQRIATIVEGDGRCSYCLQAQPALVAASPVLVQ